MESQPCSRTGENPPYGMIGGIEETSASFEARSAPHPTRPYRPISRRNRMSGVGCIATVAEYLVAPNILEPRRRQLGVAPWLRAKLQPLPASHEVAAGSARRGMTASLRHGHQFEHVSVRIAEIDAAAAAPVVELAVFEAPWRAAVSDFLSRDAPAILSRAGMMVWLSVIVIAVPRCEQGRCAPFCLSTGHNREAPVPQSGPFHVCRHTPFPQYTVPLYISRSRVERYCGNAFPVSGQDLGATRPTQTDGINRVGESLSLSAARMSSRSASSILRKSPADNQRPSYSPGTRRGARRSTSPSCRSCCGGSNKRHKRFGRSTRIFRRRTI